MKGEVERNQVTILDPTKPLGWSLDLSTTQPVVKSIVASVTYDFGTVPHEYTCFQDCRPASAIKVLGRGPDLYVFWGWMYRGRTGQRRQSTGNEMEEAAEQVEMCGYVRLRLWIITMWVKRLLKKDQW